MSLLDILANPGIGNLLLLIAAIIGVYGSYWLYQVRLDDRRDATRRALKAEIESASGLDTLIRQDAISGSPPEQILHPTTAYEGHIEEIGLLDDEEIDLISVFYSNMIILNDILKWHRETYLKVNLSGSEDKNRPSRDNDINSMIKNIIVDRWKAAQILRKHLGEEYEQIEKMEFPESTGDTISKDHPILEPNLEYLTGNGYLEQSESDPDMYQLTEKGEEWVEDRDMNEDYDLDHELSLT